MCCARSAGSLFSQLADPNTGAPFASSAVATVPSEALKFRVFSNFSASCGVNCEDLGCGSDSGSTPLLRGHGRPRSSWNVVLSRKKIARLQTRVHCTANWRPQEEATSTMSEIQDLSEHILSLKGVVSREYRSIGPEMRDRVAILCERATILQQSAEQAISSGGSIPTQVTANLIALQRDHGSLENIVRLALEPAPVVGSLDLARPTGLSDTVPTVLLEESKPKSTAFQSLVRERDVKPVRSAPNYVMSAAAAATSPSAALRAEVERRVIEQLAKMKGNNGASSRRTSETGTRASEEAAFKKELIGETYQSQEKNKSWEMTLSAAEVAGTVTSLDKKLQQLELDVSKSIPLHIFEQRVSKINISLSEARAQVVKLTAEAMEKEAMVAAVKKEMMAEQEQLMQKVRELTGDLEKKFSLEEMQAAVNFGLERVERELEEEQDRAERLTIELEKKEKLLVEQQEKWRIREQEMEKKLVEEQERSLILSLELEAKEKLLVEREEEWMIEKLSLQSDLKSVKEKMQEIRKKRTKERAQLAEKKQKVKVLQEELSRIQESMEEADRLGLKKKEAAYATVRALISQMIQASRARAVSEAHATTLVQQVAKLQEEKHVLECTTRAAEEKIGLAVAEVENMKSNLTRVGREVANLQGDLLSGERGAALEKFFGIMSKLIKKETENIENSAFLSLETDWLSENGASEVPDISEYKYLAPSADDRSQDAEAMAQTVTPQKEMVKE